MDVATQVQTADREVASAQAAFARDYKRSSEVMFAEYAQHEIFYNVLCMVSDESDEASLDKGIAALPQMRVALRTPRYYLDALAESGALRREPAREEGDPQEGDIPAEADTAATKAANMGVAHYRWYVTEVGEHLIADLSPTLRLMDLVARDEQAWPIYREMLGYCEAPRKRTEVEEHLQGKGLMDNRGVFTSFFLDKLEQNGGLVWDGDGGPRKKEGLCYGTCQ